MHRFGMQVSFFSCTVHGEQVCEFRKLVLSGQITFLFVCIHKNVLFTGASRESPNTQPRDLLNISSLNYICYALICTTGLIKDRLLITSLPCIQTGVHWGIVTGEPSNLAWRHIYGSTCNPVSLLLIESKVVYNTVYEIVHRRFHFTR